MAGGFTGKIIWVDLTLGKIHEKTLSENFFKSWLGGYGLGARIIYSDITPKTDPLGSGNILGFTTGLLTGTLTPLGSGFTVVGKSPLTGTWGDSRAGVFSARNSNSLVLTLFSFRVDPVSRCTFGSTMGKQ